MKIEKHILKHVTNRKDKTPNEEVLFRANTSRQLMHLQENSICWTRCIRKKAGIPDAHWPNRRQKSTGPVAFASFSIGWNDLPI